MEMNPRQARGFLDQNPDCRLLDVREPEEHALCSIEGNLHLPLALLAENLAKFDDKQPVIAYCHHGVRSLAAVRLLRAKGFAMASSLRGGIDLWAIEIDPTLARY
ncbi:MAG: rhodanese-like domain-containing protein [Opitutales bacterium]